MSRPSRSALKVPAAPASVATYSLPFTAADMPALAKVARLPLVAPADNATVAEALNDALLAFAMAGQATTAPGAAAEWFGSVAERVAALRAAFGDAADYDAPDRAEAMFRRWARKPDEVAPFPHGLTALLAQLDELARVAASLASNAAGAMTGRKREPAAELALFAVIRREYVRLFGRQAGFSRAPDGGEPYGPSVRFASAVLNTAADRLEDAPAGDAFAGLSSVLRALDGPERLAERMREHGIRRR